MWAVFCCLKHSQTRSLASGHPGLDPMDYGRGDEPEPELLLRRNRVGLFSSEAAAKAALTKTGKACSGQEWLKHYSFVVLECVDRLGWFDA
jgi:hypothetical protein